MEKSEIKKYARVCVEKRRRNMMQQAVNPYLPQGEYIPDGEPYVFGDRV